MLYVHVQVQLHVYCSFYPFLVLISISAHMCICAWGGAQNSMHVLYLFIRTFRIKHACVSVCV